MQDPEPVILHHLLRRLALGEETALEELYRALAPRVFALLLRMLGSREEAEEVLQDTFLRLYRLASRYDPGRGEAKTFVYAIARNLALSRLRQRRRQPPKDLALDPQDPDGEREEALGFYEEGREERVLAARALESLPPEERALLERAFYEGLSHRELAEETGLPLGTVKAKIRRALLKLRQLLGEA